MQDTITEQDTDDAAKLLRALLEGPVYVVGGTAFDKDMAPLFPADRLEQAQDYLRKCALTIFQAGTASLTIVHLLKH